MGKTMKSIDELIRGVQAGYTAGTIQRDTTTIYSAADVLRLMDAIGKKRNPRFTLDSENMPAYKGVAQWLAGEATAMASDPESGESIPATLTKGLWIGGPTGSGKSWLLDIAARTAKILGLRYYANGGWSALEWQNVRAVDVCDCYRRFGETEKYNVAGVLGLQDVGSEPEESVFMGNRLDVIRQLLEYRGDYATKITMATSNLTYSEIATRYGDRVASRAYSMFNYYEIVGKDRRK